MWGWGAALHADEIIAVEDEVFKSDGIVYGIGKEDEIRRSDGGSRGSGGVEGVGGLHR